jgi:predicted metal-binding membrane protein
VREEVTRPDFPIVARRAKTIASARLFQRGSADRCCPLMVALFALGIMSLSWMALISALIALEKMLPSRRIAAGVTATILLCLGVLVLAWPSVIPGLNTPSKAPMDDMAMVTPTR